jgi:hypothetical protein
MDALTYKSNLFDKVFYKIESEDVIAGLLKFSHFYHTRKIMEENLTQKRAIVNTKKFGEGLVFKNFGSEAIQV